MILYNSIGAVKNTCSECPAIVRNKVPGTNQYVYCAVWYDAPRDMVVDAVNEEISYKHWSLCETDGTLEGLMIFDKLNNEKAKLGGEDA